MRNVFKKHFSLDTLSSNPFIFQKFFHSWFWSVFAVPPVGVAAPRSPAFFNLRPTKNVMLRQMSRPNMLEHFLIEEEVVSLQMYFSFYFLLSVCSSLVCRHQQNINENCIKKQENLKVLFILELLLWAQFQACLLSIALFELIESNENIW